MIFMIPCSLLTNCFNSSCWFNNYLTRSRWWKNFNLVSWKILLRFATNINRTAHPVSIIIFCLHKLHTLSIFQNSFIVWHLAWLCRIPSSIISSLMPVWWLHIQINFINLLWSTNIDTHLSGLCLTQVSHERRILISVFGMIVMTR